MATAVVGFLSQDKKESLYLRLIEVDKNGNRMNIFAENNGGGHAMRQIAGSIFLGQKIDFDVARTSSGVQLMLNGKVIGTGIKGPTDGYLVLACSSGESDFQNMILD